MGWFKNDQYKIPVLNDLVNLQEQKAMNSNSAF